MGCRGPPKSTQRLRLGALTLPQQAGKSSGVGIWPRAQYAPEIHTLTSAVLLHGKLGKSSTLVRAALKARLLPGAVSARSSPPGPGGLCGLLTPCIKWTCGPRMLPIEIEGARGNSALWSRAVKLSSLFCLAASSTSKVQEGMNWWEMI